MPDLHIWLAFVLAAEALLILPGPTDMVVVSYALTQGKRSAWASVPGVTLGDATALILSLLGLGAILMASAELFNILKIAGDRIGRVLRRPRHPQLRALCHPRRAGAPLHPQLSRPQEHQPRGRRRPDRHGRHAGPRQARGMIWIVRKVH